MAVRVAWLAGRQNRAGQSKCTLLYVCTCRYSSSSVAMRSCRRQDYVAAPAITDDENEDEDGGHPRTSLPLTARPSLCPPLSTPDSIPLLLSQSIGIYLPLPSPISTVHDPFRRAMRTRVFARTVDDVANRTIVFCAFDQRAKVFKLLFISNRIQTIKASLKSN